MKFLILLLTVLPLALSVKPKTACKCARVECPTVNEPNVRINLALPHPMFLRMDWKFFGQDANHKLCVPRNASVRIKPLSNVPSCAARCLKSSSAHSAGLGHRLHH